MNVELSDIFSAAKPERGGPIAIPMTINVSNDPIVNPMFLLSFLFVIMLNAIGKMIPIPLPIKNTDKIINDNVQSMVKMKCENIKIIDELIIANLSPLLLIQLTITDPITLPIPKTRINIPTVDNVSPWLLA